MVCRRVTKPKDHDSLVGNFVRINSGLANQPKYLVLQYLKSSKHILCALIKNCLDQAGATH